VAFAKAVQVPFPTMPSAVILAFFWNSITAFRVFSPKSPSGVTFEGAKILFSNFYNSETSCPFAPFRRVLRSVI
jgi:hypothetical protein